MTIQFFVRGNPVTQGSLRAIRNPNPALPPIVVHDNPANLKAWRAAIADAARRASGHAAPITDPVTVAAHFFISRPRGHYGTGKNADVLKPSAPASPATKPDIDKLGRALLDALKKEAALYRDDSQVIRLVIEKHYTDADYPSPGVEVRIRTAPLTESLRRTA